MSQTERGEMVPKPDVKAKCKTCLKSGDWSGDGVVSPTGIEHAGKDYGMTYCGIDATGDDWWWPA